MNIIFEEGRKEKRAMTPCPEVYVTFDLTFDGTLAEDMFNTFGHNTKGGRHNGPAITDKPTRKFMLVSIGFQPSLTVAKKVLEAKYGSTPEGQWMNAFKDKYEANKNKSPVGVADDSWITQGGRAYFPYLRSNGEPFLCRSDYSLHEYWLWLVFAPSPASE